MKLSSYSFVKAVAALVTSLGVAGCAGGDPSLTRPPPAAASPSAPRPASDSPYGITLLLDAAGHPEQSGWTKITPVDWGMWGGLGADRTGALAQAATPGAQPLGLQLPPLRLDVLPQPGDGGVVPDTSQQDATNNYAAGWSLLYWATASCYSAARSVDDPDLTRQPSRLEPCLYVDYAPWLLRDVEMNGVTDYYNFVMGCSDIPPVPDTLSCDTQLLMQETLLCAADRLSQLGDSPGGAIWKGSNKDERRNLTDTFTVTIPPQRAEDLFIARDIALNALAHILKLDTKSKRFCFPSPGGCVAAREDTCVGQYTQMATTGTFAADVLGNVKGSTPSKYFDPEAVDTGSATSIEAAGKRRLVRKANLLISAARLAKDLVERNVQDDIAGAQQQASAATDRLAGARAAWGATTPRGDGYLPLTADPSIVPYNTLRHAIRSLFGRLEIGNDADVSFAEFVDGGYVFSGNSRQWAPHGITRDNPLCAPPPASGFDALDLAFAIPGVSARWDDAPAKTAGERLAESIIARAGIVISTGSKDVLSQYSSGVRQAVTQQLLEDEANRVNWDFSQPDSFSETPDGQGVLKMLDPTAGGISDDELLFGVARAYDKFRALVGADVEVDPGNVTSKVDVLKSHLAAQAALAGLQQKACPMDRTLCAIKSIEDIGGIVISRGLPLADLNADVVSSLGATQAFGQCGVYPRTDNLSNAFTLTQLDYALGPNAQDVSGFQNPFLMAEGFRRQLAAIAGGIADSTAADALSDVRNFAQLSAAEVRAWVGPGTLLEAGRDPLEPLVLYLVNFSLDDLGVASLEELKSRLVLVPSPAYSATGPLLSAAQADCAAGLRSQCGTVTTVSPSGTPTQVDASSARIGYGLDNKTIKVVFPEPTGSPLGNHVVLTPWGAHAGKVLGWLRSSQGFTDWIVESASDEQRKLANQVFGVAPQQETARTCNNIAPLSLPTDYCVAGMKRDQFVPLANELNSSGNATNIDDSWKNYLALARAAADKADQLGEQLIREGLDQDLRKESATETLGTLCGPYTSVDGASTQNGDVQPASDQQLSECTNPRTVDILFFREDPYHDSGASAVQTGHSDEIRSVYCNSMSSGTSPPFCSRSGPVSHAGLNFHSSTVRPPEGDLTRACGDLTQTLNNLSSGNAQVEVGSFGTAVQQEWVTSNALTAALGSMSLVEHPDGEWVLKIGQHVISGSDSFVQSELMNTKVGTIADVWPQCMKTALSPMRCSTTGNFIGTVFGPVPSGTQYMDLRVRMEQVVFYMGAMAGRVPPHVFSIPVPLANRRNSTVATSVIPAPALYGPSYYRANGGSFYAVTDTPDDGTSSTTNPSKLFNPWSHDSELVSQAQSFPSASSSYLSDLRARYSAQPNKLWQYTVYDQALAHTTDNGYLYQQTDNALIDFDDVLSPADSKSRDTLRTWLMDQASAFNALGASGGNSGAGNASSPAVGAFLSNLEAATFLTQKSHGSDSQAAIPVQFCGGGTGTYAHGRSVCVNAPQSPTFFYTYDQFPGESCVGGSAPTADSNLVVTANGLLDTICLDPLSLGSVASDDCTASDIGGAPQVFPRKAGSAAWMALDLAAGNTTPAAPNFWDWSQSPNVGGVAGSQSLNTPFTSVPVTTAGIASQFLASGHVRNFMIDTDESRSPTFIPGQWFAHGRVESIWKDRLRPSQCPPEQRVEMFLNTDVKSDYVGAMQRLVQGLALSCAYDNQNLTVKLADPPPVIASVEDIAQLEAWQSLLGYDIDKIPNALYLVDMPQDLVDLANNGQSDVGAVTAGDRGKLLLDLQDKLNLLELGFATLGSKVQEVGGAIKQARYNIQGALLANKVQQLTIAGAQLENNREMALANIAIVAGTIKMSLATSKGPSLSSVLTNGSSAALDIIQAGEEVADGATNLFFGAEKEKNLVAQVDAQNDVERNQEQQIVAALGTQTQTLYQAIDDAITGLKNNNDAALQDITGLNQNAQAAKIALAKATGADFMEVNGKQVPLHVNTVYRRQFDITKQRYGLALEAAKRAAYLARLSIEQRLGVRLDELHQNVGALEAPASWVDQLCSVQGVNYDALRQASGAAPTSAGEVDAIKGFANQFIGDYVDKLEQFVQYYNLQFPFADGNDVAIVSLREDLPSSQSQCTTPSPNLLLQSDKLIVPASGISNQSMVAHGGWRTTNCVAQAGSDGGISPMNCLNLADDVAVLPPDNLGHGTVLSIQSLDPAALKMPPGGPAAAPTLAPTNGVFQTVSLVANTEYVLSWWDMARNPDGSVLSSGTPAAYSAGVFDSNWSAVKVQSFTPSGGEAGVWGTRNEILFAPTADGEYHVVFVLPGALGSAVAIANVQLEAATGNQVGASAYVSNSSSLMQTTGRCPADTPEQFRARFNHTCDQLGCWFELKDVLSVDTQLVNSGKSSLVGKIAPGNFNYRNNTLAVNVVGTGVIDCSKAVNSSCNGSAYVNYDLRHMAFNVPIEDYEGGIRCFDFGAGHVRGAKALAAERFITLPMSSSDRDMVDQSPFLKPEFSGRPLSGSYRLRILDEPQLVWQNVNDIQIVMNYSYWSRVDRSPSN